MSVLDKFINTIRLGGDYDGFDDEEDFLDDEDYPDDDYEEERPKRRILSRRQEEEEFEETPEPEPRQERTSQSARSSASRASRSPARSQSPKVSPMRSKKQGSMEVCVIRPQSMEDAHEITETLREGCTVILNMEGLEISLAQRLIDFSCGSCYALSGALQKISNYIFIITPQGVDISGDFQEALNGGAFEVPAFSARF